MEKVFLVWLFILFLWGCDLGSDGDPALVQLNFTDNSIENFEQLSGFPDEEPGNADEFNINCPTRATVEFGMDALNGSKPTQVEVRCSLQMLEDIRRHLITVFEGQTLELDELSEREGTFPSMRCRPGRCRLELEEVTFRDVIPYTFRPEPAQSSDPPACEKTMTFLVDGRVHINRANGVLGDGCQFFPFSYPLIYSYRYFEAGLELAIGESADFSSQRQGYQRWKPINL